MELQARERLDGRSSHLQRDPGDLSGHVGALGHTFGALGHPLGARKWGFRRSGGRTGAWHGDWEEQGGWKDAEDAAGGESGGERVLVG